MRSTCALINNAAPTSESETATETINATVIVKLRRNPLPTSLLTNENLMTTAPYVRTCRALDRELPCHFPFEQYVYAFGPQSLHRV